MDDAELMQRWQNGDATAFEAIVTRWQQPVARFLYRMTGRADLVGDLCQEVFLRVYKSSPRYREGGVFTSWLFRVALNIARDAARRGRRLPGPLDDDPPDGAAGAETVCQQRELAGVMARAVAELPEPLRLALTLRHDEEMSFEEIARLTGTPASTVKSRFAAALARLRTQLEPLGYGPGEISL